jgi:predicted amidophosphoribosyltransferase
MPVQVLERHRATAQQVGLTSAARRTNLRWAFRLREAEKAGLAGHHILLVDHV